MIPLRALIRKELTSLFGAPTAYLTLTMVALVTALVFFDHLRLYNQVLFAYASTTMGGFASGTIPDYINLWDMVFFPVMEQMGLTLLGAIPLVTIPLRSERTQHLPDEHAAERVDVLPHPPHDRLIARDPGELHDRAADEPDTLSLLRSHLTAWQDELSLVSLGLAPEEAVDPEVLRRLRALGYVQ